MLWTFALSHMQMWDCPIFKMALLPLPARTVFIFGFWDVIPFIKMSWADSCVIWNKEFFSVNCPLPLFSSGLGCRHFKPPQARGSGEAIITTMAIYHGTSWHYEKLRKKIIVWNWRNKFKISQWQLLCLTVSQRSPVSDFVVVLFGSNFKPRHL